MPLKAVRPLRRGRSIAYVVVGLAAAALLPPAALAADEGAGPGGASPESAPVVRSLECRSRCTPARVPRPESLLRVHGDDLGGVVVVLLLGGKGTDDDVRRTARRVRPGRFDVRLPRRARTGGLIAITADGARSRRVRVRVAPAEESAPETAARAPAGQAAPHAPQAADGDVEADVDRPKVFFDARPALLRYTVHGDAPAHVAIELVRVADGLVLEDWDVGSVPPETPRSLRWNGLVDGRPQPEGRYKFRVVTRDPAQAAAASEDADDVAEDSFMLLAHRFPVRGPHDYGGYAARFGGGRGHQGQDVFAQCGTPLVAARGGQVKWRAYHSAAGHYLVIDGHRTGVDYAYMHLRDVPLLAAGDRVRTGQRIGFVGQTGRATGCHLHFEMWSAPGWYSGGAAFDPLPHLLAWDARS